MMSTWFSLSLGDGVWAAAPSEQIEAVFQPLFIAAGQPAAMAVFTRLETEGRLHCEAVAYFSPAAGEPAGRVGAQPCAKPARRGLRLLAGEPACWTALFPDEGA